MKENEDSSPSMMKQSKAKQKREGFMKEKVSEARIFIMLKLTEEGKSQKIIIF